MQVLRIAVAWLALAGLAWCQWSPQVSGTAVPLRGVHAVSATVVWASGANGTVLKTLDGGVTWQPVPVPGAATVDFRAIWAFDAQTALVMSAGAGKASRIYKTIDGGSSWKLVVQNTDEAGFFDAIAFWNPQHGLVIGDPVDGRFFISTTADGATWQRVEPASIPRARTGEGAFAASGTCLTVQANGLAWIGTGGPGGARVFRSSDWGRTWQVSETPLRHDDNSSGIFSVAFRDSKHGIAVGGNYSKPQEDRDNFALSSDGGVTWKAPARTGPRGYRSAVAYIPGTHQVIATGTSGTDLSQDAGVTWKHLSDDPFNAVSFASAAAGWAVGPKGAIAKYAPQAMLR